MTLNEYLNHHYPELVAAKQNAAFGKLLGVKRQSVERWRKFQQSPSLETAYQIWQISGREVDPISFLSQAKRRDLMKQLGTKSISLRTKADVCAPPRVGGTGVRSPGPVSGPGPRRPI
jgi:DNA-binding XRE family transcriptional regulator